MHTLLKTIKSIKQQAWYLTQGLAILSLFNKEILYEDRRYIADTLLAIPVPAAFVPGKPSFQMNILNADSTIASLNPWLLFHLLSQDRAWLRLSVGEWNDNQEYTTMSAVMSDLAVVTERSIKDSEEFANYGQDGDEQGKIVTISDSHRIKCQSFDGN